MPETTSTINDEAVVSQQPAHVKAGFANATLMSAVATLKGISDDAIAAAINVPVGSVSAWLSGRNVGYREDMLALLGSFLGVDLESSRLSQDRVHIFDLSKLPLTSSKERIDVSLQVVGYLLRDAKFAGIRLGSGSRITGNKSPKVRVGQNNNSRAVFIGGSCLTFKPQFDPAVHGSACQWAAADAAKSVVTVTDPVMIRRVENGDLTISEFDQLFRGPSSTTLDDVEMAARVNGLTNEEIVEWIETIGAARAQHRLRTQQLPVMARDWSAAADATNVSQLPLAANNG